MHTHHEHDEPVRRAGLAHLSDLRDFEVASGYPDIRGWSVITANGAKLGKVHDLIVDTNAMRTRYLDVTLAKHVASTGDDRDVLLPIGAASLNRKNEMVLINDDVVAKVNALPEYRHGASTLTRDYENSVLTTLGAPPLASDYEDHKHFDDKRFFKGDRPIERDVTREAADVTEERVIERRPMIEEVIVRKRHATDEEIANKLRRET
jgi:photosynthetic reaction center H subunit